MNECEWFVSTPWVVGVLQSEVGVEQALIVQQEYG